MKVLMSKNSKKAVHGEEPQFPEPKAYPISRDQFLNLMLPSMRWRTDQQNAILRLYLKNLLMNPTWP